MSWTALLLFIFIIIIIIDIIDIIIIIIFFMQGSPVGCPFAVQCQAGSGIQVLSLDPSFTDQV